MMLINLIKKLLYRPHKYAKRHPGINLDEKAVLLPGAHFSMHSNSNRIDIHSGSMLACNFVFESDSGYIQIGEGTFINGNSSLICRSEIEVGKFVTIAWGCTIYDHNSHSLDYRHRVSDIKRQLHDYRSGQNFIQNKDWSTVKSKKITIEDYAWIGMNCTILSGVTVGKGAIIGAGSVVRHDVEPWTVVAGNPAQFVKRLKNGD